jgi:hypothetical protein
MIIVKYITLHQIYHGLITYIHSIASEQHVITGGSLRNPYCVSYCAIVEAPTTAFLPPAQIESNSGNYEFITVSSHTELI